MAFSEDYRLQNIIKILSEIIGYILDIDSVSLLLHKSLRINVFSEIK